MPNSSQGFGGSGGFQQGWSPFGSSASPVSPTNPIGGASTAQMPAGLSQAQQPISAQLPSGGGAGNYAQTIQQLGSLGDLYQGGTMPGGATMSRTSAPAGVNPMDLLTPVMTGQAQLPGGQMTGGTPTYSPFAPTGYEVAAGKVSGDINNPSMSGVAKSEAPTIAGALNDYSLGLGPPTGGTGMDYATMGNWLKNPSVQQGLSYNFAPSQGYEDWQQQQNWSSMLGDLSSWTAKH